MDQVELNPDAVRRGLTQRKAVTLGEPTRKLVVTLREPVDPISEEEQRFFVGESIESTNKNRAAFGIIYNPIKLGDESSYSAPSGPAFEDELEFERQLSKTAIESKEDTDFDYDFDVIDNQAIPMPADPLPAPVNTMPVSAYTKPKTVDFVELMGTSLEMVVAVPTVAVTDVTAALEIIQEEGMDDISDEQDEQNQLIAEVSLDNFEEPIDTLLNFQVVKRLDEPEEENKLVAEALLYSIEDPHDKPLNDQVVEISEDQWDCLTVENVDQMMPCMTFEQGMDSLVPNDPENHLTRSWTSRLFNRHIPLPQMVRVSKLAKTKFDWKTPLHKRLLLDLFKSLTESTHDCATGGSHWEIIGFQGGDPSTDLRGAGLLAVLQMLWLSENHRNLCHEILRVSNTTIQDFPMMAISINFSLICVQVLENNNMDKYPDAVSAANSLFLAMWQTMFHQWKSKQLTIMDFPPLLVDIRKSVFKKPKKFIQVAPRLSC